MPEKISFEQANNQADLFSLCDSEKLSRVAASNGGEWAGPCPFCGGDDRFHIQPNAQPPRWLCRHCTGGRWQSAVDFLVRRDHLTPLAAARLLLSSGCDVPARRSAPDPDPNWNLPASRRSASRCNTPARRSTPDPDPTWNVLALQAIYYASQNLSRLPPTALPRQALAQRGLNEPTLAYFLIGFSPGLRLDCLYVPPGILIPCLEDEQVQYLKISLLPGQPVQCPGCGKPAHARQPCPVCGKIARYTAVRGSRAAALFNLEELRLPSTSPRPVLFVEGEFDCLAAWQQVRDQVAVVTLGSAAGRIDLARYASDLARAGVLYCLYDNDPAGLAGRKALRRLLGGALHDLYLPEQFKDINDFTLQGGRLADLLPTL
jgi:hypothetical protein